MTLIILNTRLWEGCSSKFKERWWCSWNSNWYNTIITFCWWGKFCPRQSPLACISLARQTVNLGQQRTSKCLKGRLGYKECVNPIERMQECCHRWPLTILWVFTIVWVATLSQPFNSVNPLIITNSTQRYTLAPKKYGNLMYAFSTVWRMRTMRTLMLLFIILDNFSGFHHWQRIQRVRYGSYLRNDLFIESFQIIKSN